MYHFDFAVIQNYLVKSMTIGAEADSTRTKNPGSSPGFALNEIPKFGVLLGIKRKFLDFILLLIEGKH